LLERISWRGIARVTGVSWSWLQNYINQNLARTPRKIKVLDKSKGRLTIECDEMWSFVASKENEFYIWLAIDRDTREIVGCYMGDRACKSARKLWESLPEFIDNVPLPTPIFGSPVKQLLPINDTEPWVKKPGKQIILND